MEKFIQVEEGNKNNLIDINDPKFKLLEKAGVRDWILNYFYDTSVFNTYLTKRLTAIDLHHTDEHIYAMEFYYDETPTGLFKGKDEVKNVEIKLTKIEFKLGEYVEYIAGSFSVDYITQLIFCLNNGKKLGFSSQHLKDRTDIKYFIFKKEEFQVYSLRLAFGRYLTYMTPVFREIDDSLQNILKFDDKSNLYTTKLVGKSYEDSINFNYENEVKNLGRILKVSIYHDFGLVKGVIVQYEKCVKNLYHNISVDNYRCEILNLGVGEKINKFMIRSGDLIDNITLYTNKGNSISAGGYGGGAFVFDLDEVKKEYGEQYEFLGFTGGYLNNHHYLKLVLSKL
jgi:hypothetical protein